MDPLTIGLITGGASLLGSIFSSNTSAQNSQLAAQQSQINENQQIAAQKDMLNQTEDFNASQAQRAEDFSADQALTQRNYETQMSNTAYQRASADMKAAGLNPMMMFGSGSSASTPSVSAPSGVSASVGTPSVPMAQFAPRQEANPWAGVGDAATRMVNSAVQMKTMDKMTDEIANLQTQRGLLEAETGVAKEREGLTRAERLRQTDLDILTQLAQPGARFSAKQSEDLLNMPDWLRSAAVVGSFTGGKLSDTIAPITNSARSLGNLIPRRSTSETTFSDGGGAFTDRWSGLYN